MHPELECALSLSKGYQHSPIRAGRPLALTNLAVCGEKGVDRRGRRQTRASSAYADR